MSRVGRYVIHLPVVATDLVRARILARTAVRALAFLTQVDPGETTVSAEDEQGVRHRVFCDRRLDRGRRCVLRADHQTPCTPRLPR
ncbi:MULTISPECIES: hypothetical protein [Micromonospora]|uniref:Uncharacterized protein n=1 Tax=Micromonospora yangpuensis TaxID=683228 RepID=A0A1C6U6W2_9ACTN|nr:hypothetical protein [Micromonospora yangpuensis]GGL90608.1 hypothetical protein GCM10012279_05500 [Micromonospora yangpuensis]SCL49724.1 hypothetical protein GA0070617_1264 [Micromonospora yangpuensis]